MDRYDFRGCFLPEPSLSSSRSSSPRSYATTTTGILSWSGWGECTSSFAGNIAFRGTAVFDAGERSQVTHHISAKFVVISLEICHEADCINHIKYVPYVHVLNYWTFSVTRLVWKKLNKKKNQFIKKPFQRPPNKSFLWKGFTIKEYSERLNDLDFTAVTCTFMS